MTAEDKYPLLNRDNLKQPIRKQWSQKLKNFSKFIVWFSKYRLNFEHFQKKADPNSWIISEIANSEKRG